MATRERHTRAIPAMSRDSSAQIRRHAIASSVVAAQPPLRLDGRATASTGVLPTPHVLAPPLVHSMALRWIDGGERKRRNGSGENKHPHEHRAAVQYRRKKTRSSAQATAEQRTSKRRRTSEANEATN
jgi:hypothetical protein